MGTRVIPPEVLSCAKQGEREPYLESLPKKKEQNGTGGHSPGDQRQKTGAEGYRAHPGRVAAVSVTTHPGTSGKRYSST